MSNFIVYALRKDEIKMETFAEYLLNEKDLVSKMDILYRLQKMLRERKNISIYFNNAVNSKNVFRIHGRGKRSR